MRKSSLRTTVAVLRQVLDMKTPEFAEVCGLSLSAIEKLETGRLKLSDEVAFRISQETGVEQDWLLAGDVAAPPRPLVTRQIKRIGPRRHQAKNLGEIYTIEYFVKWRTGLSKVPPLWSPEKEAARLAGIISRAIRAGHAAYAKHRIDKILAELEAEYGMNEKKRRWVQESLLEAARTKSRAVRDNQAP